MKIDNVLKLLKTRIFAKTGFDITPDVRLSKDGS